MPRLIKKGSTDITLYFFIVDSSDGSPETGITITNLDLQYVRFGAAPVAKVDATELAATDSAHADNQMKEVDATDQPGLYRVDWPDAAFASGVDGVVLTVKGTGFHPAHMEIQLVDYDPTDSVRLGLTALPNAAADAAGGLPISDAGALDMDSKLANTNEVTAARMGALTDWIDGGRLDLLLDAIPTTAMRGTDNAALASVLGALADAAADGDPTNADTLMQYVKQLINILIGTAGIPAFPAEAAPANDVSLAEVIRAIHVDVTGLNGVAMRGTDSGALASVATEARLAELASANMPADLDTLLTRITAAVALASVCTEGRLAELDAGNLPAGVDTLLARITAAVALASALTTHDNKLAPVALDGGGATIGGMLTKIADDNGGVDFDAELHSQKAIRDRGDAAWTTGGGGSITDILNTRPLIPTAIDLADTATVRLSLGLTNALDDLPSTAEITPGTISIDRKAIGGTSWTNIVNDAACSEAAGLVYYDEVFDSGSGYAAGDSIRITFKNQKIVVAANDYEITGSDGWMCQTYIRVPAGAGAGATEWTYTLTSTVAPNNPIADADVWVTSDEAGNNVIASGTTDANGVVTFYLDDGSTVYVWRQKSGWNFTNPDTEVVS